jgi:hypothetical protein
MIVDCGDDTIDLTVHKLVGNNQLSKVIIESTGNCCGSTFIDEEYIKFLRNKLGDNAINSFRNEYYNQFQYMVQDFCENAKIPFTGDDLDFSYEIDIEEVPILLQYVSKETKHEMKKNNWVIIINYNDIKAMFDPVINRIVELIYSQLSNTREKCSVMFLVGDFSESKYLQKRIKQEFQHRVKNILVPIFPTAAISRGAVMYGSSLKMYGSLKNSINNNLKGVISTRVLKYTYGVKVRNYWVSFFDHN